MVEYKPSGEALFTARRVPVVGFNDQKPYPVTVGLKPIQIPGKLVSGQQGKSRQLIGKVVSEVRLATQEELEYLYEVTGIRSIIEKIDPNGKVEETSSIQIKRVDEIDDVAIEEIEDEEERFPIEEE